MTGDQPLPVGEMKLIDDLQPTLAGGDWHVLVTHDIVDGAGPVNPQPFTATQEVIVTAPQFAIDASAITATFPPDTSAGQYAQVLPHIVLADPLLPWERQLGQPGTPWLALLVLTDDEVIGGDASPTRTQSTTVAGLLASDPAVRKPATVPDPGVNGSDPAMFVQIPVGVFADISPRLTELRYLAHCRQVNTGDKVIAGLDADGMFAVVVASRFPAAGPAGTTGATKNIVHLVSLDGLADVLVQEPDWKGAGSVAVVSLASWTFSAQPEQAGDFRDLAAGLVGDGTASGLLLRLPVPFTGSTDPNRVAVRDRLTAGFVPLSYQTRSGESTFAWARGPLTPVLPAPLPPGQVFRTADAALAYDGAHGLFDVSLAAAFTLGRGLALSDRLFSQRLLELRQRLHTYTDALLYRLRSDNFSQTQIDQISQDTTIAAELMKVLDAQLLADVGAGPSPVAPPVPVAPAIPQIDPDPKTALQRFIATPQAQAAIVDAVKADLDPVSGWLARLLLLYPVPFPALVPDQRLLPAESLRFFYLDPNWLGAAVDGALSIALESSLHTFYDAIIGDTIRQAAADAARVYRDVLRGVDPAKPDPPGQVLTCGLLLRSALVTGWPNLSVRGYDSHNGPVPLLRMDRLGSTVLLCLFYGIPAAVELSEPHEGFAFGVEGGATNLRNLLPMPNPRNWQLGEVITGAVLPVIDPAGQRPVCLRSVASRVLAVDPAVPTGLVAALGTALNATLGQQVTPLGPADVALELVRPPQAVRFAGRVRADEQADDQASAALSCGRCAPSTARRKELTMTDPALIVPTALDALVVDQFVLGHDNFRRWPFAYTALRDFMSPEPDEGDRNTGGVKTGIYLHWTLPDALRHGTGDSPAGAPVYPPVPNRWLIARFTGTQQRTVTAWVVESDCPFTARAKSDGYDDTQCSLYLVEPAIISAWLASSDPYRNGVSLNPASTSPQVANIGIGFRADGWRERSAAPTFLTALAPGNPVFSAYTAHNTGVFSYYDALTGISSDTVSYAVLGWYADAAQDVLAAGVPFKELLDALGWKVVGPAADSAQPKRSIYQGIVASIPWRRDGVYPAGAAPRDPLHDIRDSGKLGVGIGNTTEDAFLALAGRELTAKGYSTSALPLLRAFLYDVLPLLNQTGGDLLARRRIADAWFGVKQGGYSWTVAPPPSIDPAGAPAKPFTTPAWLAQLNRDQARLDADLTALYSLQWQFNAMWLKNGLLPNEFPPPDGAPDPSQITAQLDPANPASLAGRLIAQLRVVIAELPSVPQPDWTGGGTAQDAFERGVAAFVAAKGGLPDTASLKAIPASPFRQAADPVVALSGVPVPASSRGTGTLAVRQAADLITALIADGKTIGAGPLPPVPSLANMPDVAGPLLAEFFLLDPASAAALAASSGVPAVTIAAAITAHAAGSYHGTLPALALGSWDSQPWQPMFFEWRVTYQPVPLGPTGPGPWVFDGEDYHLGAAGTLPPIRSVGAISLLSQQTRTLFGARLAAFVKQNADETALRQLDDWLDTIDAWQVLSQELVGFSDLLAQRDHRAFRRPTAADTIGPASAPLSVADLAGYAGASTGSALSLPERYRGQVTTWPYLPTGTAVPFAGVRAGQMYFTEVLLYDKFGRVLHVVEPGQDAGLYQAANFPVNIDPAFAVDASLAPTIASVIQLPPRLVQGARLDLTLLDGATGAPVTEGDPAANPVGGWVLPNHLDASLLLYAADGVSLGSYRLLATATGARNGAWEPPAHGKVSTLAEVAALAPLVAAFIEAPELAAEASFDALLGVIDTTLWTVDPAGAGPDQSLSLLVGRPLALVKVQAALTLDGAALTAAGWPATISPPAPDFLTVGFPVRLGDQATRDDGLVGYFAAGRFDTFNAVTAPGAAPAQSYVRQIGPPGLPGAGGQNYLTVTPAVSGPSAGGTDVVLLLDPRATVHATTGIVPAVTLRIPDRFIGPALSELELQFHMPATVTFRRPTPAPADQPPAFAEAITFPLPAGAGGQWSWWQLDATDGWIGAAVLDAPTDAQLTGAPGTVVDGVLQLIVGLEPDS